MKKYRMWYMNINSGDEFYIEINNSDEILPALQQKHQYVSEPDNWECFDQEEIRNNPPEETFTAFIYEDDGITAADLSTYDTEKEAVDFAKMRKWDEVVNDNTGEVVWRK